MPLFYKTENRLTIFTLTLYVAVTAFTRRELQLFLENLSLFSSNNNCLKKKSFGRSK